MQTEVAVGDLEAGFRAYCGAADITVRGTLFRRSLKVLEGSLAQVRQEEGESLVLTADPSIADFLAAWLAEAPAEALALYRGGAFFAQVEWAARSVLPRVKDEALRAEHMATLAEAAMRLFSGGDPRWELMHFGTVYSSARLTRTVKGPAARLVFLLELGREVPEFGHALGGWLGEAIEAESDSWEERQMMNAAEPVGLVRALTRVGRPRRSVAERAMAHLLGHLRGVYEWEQLIALREMVPDLFEDEDRLRLEDRFDEFAETFAADPETIDQVEEVDSLSTLGDELGVDLDHLEIGRLREEVAGRIGRIEEHLEAQQEEDHELRRWPDLAGDEDQEIEALFGRLAEERQD